MACHWRLGLSTGVHCLRFEPLATLPPLSRARPSATLISRKYEAGLNVTFSEAMASLLPVGRRSGLSAVNVQAVPVKLSPEKPVSWKPWGTRSEEMVRGPTPAVDSWEEV